MLAAEDGQFIFVSYFELSSDLRMHDEFLLILPAIFCSLSSKIIQSYKY